MSRQAAATLYALLAVFLWSTVASAFKLSLQKLSIVELLFYASLTSLLVQGSIIVISGQVPTLLKTTRRDLVFSCFQGLLNPFAFYLVKFQAYVGCFEMGLTYILWSKALKLSRSALQVSIFIYICPFLSLVFIHIFVGETILASTIAGLLLIISGIGLQQFLNMNRR